MAKLSIKVFDFNLTVSAEFGKAKTAEEHRQEVKDSINKACVEEIRKHKRQGGLLSGT